MMKKLNTPQFFSLCFLAALMAEAYCFIVLEGDPISVVGIGVVVLITAYLLLDSILGKASQSRDKAKVYVETIYKEETEQWKERYSELVNIQKATYSAFKKNSALMEEQIKELHSRLESLEETNSKAMLRIAELQMKALEGQKNAVNLEVKYNKQNTLQIIDAIREESGRNNNSEDLAKILDVLSANHELLEEYRNVLENLRNESFSETSYDNTALSFFDEDEEQEASKEYMEEEVSIEDTFTSSAFIEDTFPDEEFEDKASDIIEEEIIEEETSEEETAEEETVEEETVEDKIVEDKIVEEINEDVRPTVIPLYDDPNKKLSPEEIAALFSSFGQ